jgi:hypothetical protein
VPELLRQIKIAAGEDVVMMGVVYVLERKPGQNIKYVEVKRDSANPNADAGTAPNPDQEEKEDIANAHLGKIELPGAADGTNAREVVCATR